MKNKKLERNILSFFLTVIFIALAFLAFNFNVLKTAQDRATDSLFTTNEASKDLIVVDIDQESLDQIGQWPWDRNIHAELLTNLEGAEKVGFDVIFSEPSSLESDQNFANAISNFSGEVILPKVISEQTQITKYPIESLRNVSKQGFVNTQTERDGVVRYYSLQKNTQLSFDVVLSESKNCPNQNCHENKLRIPFSGPTKTYNTISYIDVYNGLIPKELVTGKTILVGASAAGLGDVYQTPFGAMPGIEIHANIIDNLNKGTELKPLSLNSSMIVVAVIGLLVFLFFCFVKSIFKTITFVIIGSLAVLSSAFLAFQYLIILPHLYFLILFLTLSVTLLLVNYVYESKEKKFIRKGFEHYVAPEVVKELSENPDKLKLGGQSKQLSILFSDIRDFTSISEKLTPEDLTEQLNEYLEEMADSVIENKGLVDKYIGDAVMAFWGAPVADSDHAKNACKTAILMIQRLEKLNKKWEKEKKPLFKIGIGISTGNVVVGNIGSRKRFNYSIIGDEVNFSSRVEGLTKSYGVNCIIGENTFKQIEGDESFVTRKLDEVNVKGKTEPKVIYELLTEQVNEDKMNCLKEFKKAKFQYKNGHFEMAEELFMSALKYDNTDGPSKVFAQRCTELKNNPPQKWTGVYEFKTK